jgi:hypothetical protein
LFFLLFSFFGRNHSTKNEKIKKKLKRRPTEIEFLAVVFDNSNLGIFNLTFWKTFPLFNSDRDLFYSNQPIKLNLQLQTFFDAQNFFFKNQKKDF